MLSPGREFVGSPPPQIGGNTYHYHHGITYTHVSTKIYQQTSSFLAIRLDSLRLVETEDSQCKSFFKTTCRSIDTEGGKLRLAWLVSRSNKRTIQSNQNGFLEFLLIDFAGGKRRLCGKCWNYKLSLDAAALLTTTNFFPEHKSLVLLFVRICFVCVL